MHVLDDYRHQLAATPPRHALVFVLLARLWVQPTSNARLTTLRPPLLSIPFLPHIGTMTSSLPNTMKTTAAIFASILASAAATPTKTPDLVLTNFAGTACDALATTSAVATVSDTCTSRGRKRAR